MEIEHVADAVRLGESDLRHLRRCIDLAAEAVAAGDHPFGSVLVAADGTVLAEDRNRVVTAGDQLAHPEIALARWAQEHLEPDARAAATVYTSGEHCPMCAVGHALVGLGRIVVASTSSQLSGWLAEMSVAPAVFRPLPITTVAPGVSVIGPVPELEEQVRALHRRAAGLSD
ncbi:nucleoside deaminase [Nocardia sp. NPDC050710]|uniref:nucleoside deaminase n=1 Tax=Nocardia sp. NPDC050710 TaxID=3157220 RepID=UPI0033C82317